MLINADVKGLEIVCAAYLSQDPVLIYELTHGVDIHADNQKKFGLPTRLIAKTLVFRILYGGTHFTQDPEFSCVSSSKAYWNEAIEAFYTKYKGIKQWHTKLIQEATTTGKVISPTGKFYPYKPDRFGEWPLTTIKNYIVQGLGADLVMISRISVLRRIKAANLQAKLISSVHDSIVVDCPKEEVDTCAALLKSSIEDVPMNFERLFGKKFSLPLGSEILVGNTLGDMKKYESSCCL